MRMQVLAGASLLLLAAGCNQMPGTPKPGVEVPRPDSITDFATLYGENCAGCHGSVWTERRGARPCQSRLPGMG